MGGKKKRKKGKNKPVEMTSLETPRNTIESAREEKRERTKDIKSVSGAIESEGGKAVTLQWRFQVFPPFEQRIIGA